jgi:hypothetical protein
LQEVPQRLQEIHHQEPYGGTDFVGRDAIVHAEFLCLPAVFKFFIGKMFG